MSVTVPLAEIFSSFQGEGLFVGVRQVFVRLRGCRLTCTYCDTPAARDESGPCRIERVPGSNHWEEVSNPVTVADAIALIAELAATAPHHSVSITGGEPLLQPAFVAELAEGVRAAGLETYLDTACCYPAAMAQVAPLVGIVAADYKLPVTLREPVAFDDFAACWQAISGVRFIKIVLTEDVTPEDLAEHCRRIADLDRAAEVVLQPVTPRGAVAPLSVPSLFALAEAAAEHLPRLRVIPQCHVLMGVK